MVWCKHGFQQGRSNFNGEFVRFKGYGATENRVGQLGLKLGYVVTAEAIRHAVVSLIAPKQRCMFCTPSLAKFLICCY